MNKKLFFALVATAGLFASCSSDDFTASDSRLANNVADDSKDAAISIGVGNPYVSTRGTGSVGYSSNKWAGQKFNMFMFEKGTFTPAQKTLADQTIVDIYNDAEMTTDKDAQTAEYVVNDVVQFDYFPANGAFDFWAYRADDAKTGDPVGVGDDAATEVKIPVTITGSQDLMVGVADTEGSLAALQAVESTADESRIYSAYAARRGVNPKLQFKHLLTRLYFYVKANTRDVSEQADLKTTDANEFKGFKIKKVEVWSKNTGNIVAAYKAPAPAAIMQWDDAQDWADVSTLTPLSLMARDKDYDPAVYQMLAVGKNAAASIPIPSDYEYAGTTGSTTLDADPSRTCYTSGDLDANTGMPTGTAMTITAARADANVTTIYLPFVKSGNRADGTKYDTYTYTIDETSPLISLEDAGYVIPQWSGYVAPVPGTLQWVEKTPATTGYTWEDITATVSAAQEAAAVVVDAAPTTATVGAVDDVKKYTDDLYNVHYYVCTAINYDTDAATDYAGTTDPITDNADGTDGQIVKVNNGGGFKYYIYHEVGGTAEVLGSAVPTAVGEALLVAPADANGYQVKLTYERSVKITGTKVENTEQSVTINIKAGEGFAAGKSYKITAVLFKDGTVSNDDIEIKEPWEEASTDEPEYNFE